MVNFEEGTLVKSAYVEINGVQHPVVMPQYEGDTPVSPENLNKMQEDLENEIGNKTQKNIATRTFGRQNVTVNQAWGTAKVSCSGFSSEGDKLEIDDNGIKIGAGVSKVLVSAQCAGIGTNVVVGDKQFMIKKMGVNTAVGNAYLGGGISINFMNLCISPILIDVQQSDVISLEVSSGATGTFEILAGQLTVEVVE